MCTSGNRLGGIALSLAVVSAAIGCQSGDSADQPVEAPVGQAEGGAAPARFTPSDACRALLRDLKIPAESPMGRELTAERFVRDDYSGDYFL